MASLEGATRIDGPTTAAEFGGERPWQLRMYEKTLKKQQKVKLLQAMGAPFEGARCLLLTGGDNNGAMNYQFRQAGGTWSWAEMEATAVAGIQGLLGKEVSQATPALLPFPDGSFDRVVVIDVHEHLEQVDPLNRELARITAAGGLVVVTTPNGNERLPVAVLKRLVGMGPAEYGHTVQGFSWLELEEMLRRVGLRPEARDAYARFFTELAELAINFGYVKVLSRKKGKPQVEKGTIAPSSENELRAVEKAYRMYSLVYPLVKTFSLLDGLVPGPGGYALAISARKPK